MINGKKWYENDKRKLIELYQLGYPYQEIAVKMDRSRFAVQSEMKLLRLQGRVGYRTSESEAAANERGLFKPHSVEFENNVVMTRPSDEGAEQAERAEGEENKKNSIMTQEKSWSKKDQQRLIGLYQLNYKFDEIATKLNRTYSAISSEVKKLHEVAIS